MLGLEVLDVEAAQRLVASGDEPGRLVAVDGWLTVAPDEPGCTELPVVACPRRGDLSGTREPGGPTLAVETLPGTPLLGLTRQSPSLGTWTVPNRVALVGHVRATPAGPVFTIERLAWLRTAARQRPVLTAPGSLTTRWSREAAERQPAPPWRAPVRRCCWRSSTGRRWRASTRWRPMRSARPAAPSGTCARSSGSLGAGADDAPVVGWSVVDDRTHEVLATGLWPEAP